MKQLRITVAGQTFDVTVETVGGSAPCGQSCKLRREARYGSEGRRSGAYAGSHEDEHGNLRPEGRNGEFILCGAR